MNNGDETLPIDSESQLCHLTVRFGGELSVSMHIDNSAEGFTVLLFVAGASTLLIAENLCG